MMVAASSLLQAAAGLLETPSQEGSARTSEVQRIDLDDPEGPTP